MKIPMVTLRAHVYAGRRLNPGDRFEATGQGDASLLKAIGRAEVYKPAPVVVAPVLAPEPVFKLKDHADNAAETAAVEGEEYVRPKRQYRRRNLTAES